MRESPPGQSGERAHIAFLTSSAPRWKGDPYSPFILGLARELQVCGVRVTVLTPHVAGSETREIIDGVVVRRFRYLSDSSAETLGLSGGMLPGLRARPLDILKVPRLLSSQHDALGRLHSEDPVDLLHTHWMIPQGIVGGRLSARFRIPHVATAHGSDILGLRLPGTRHALRYVTERSDVVTVNSRAMHEELATRTGFTGAEIVAMGAGVPEPSSIRGNLELRRSLPDAGYVLGFVGRVVADKGILEFLRVVAALRSDSVPVAGLVVGGGSAEDRARRMTHELGLEHSVRFVGSVAPDQVALYMSVMDVLVVPSRYEAFGLVAVEAMLSGLPVVCFGTGGLNDVVIPDKTGLSVAPGDHLALGTAVRRILDDRRLRARIVEGGLDHARGSFTLAAAARRFAAIYHALLPDHRVASLPHHDSASAGGS